MVHVAVGVVSRVHGISRSLRQHVCAEWLPALELVEICSVVDVTGCVDDAKEEPAAE
jgi:hypothetical protein